MCESWWKWLRQWGVVPYHYSPPPHTNQQRCSSACIVHHKHTHMPLLLACTAHHPPTHPLQESQIISYPWPSPMPYNCAPFPGPVLLPWEQFIFYVKSFLGHDSVLIGCTVNIRIPDARTTFSRSISSTNLEYMSVIISISRSWTSFNLSASRPVNPGGAGAAIL